MPKKGEGRSVLQALLKPAGWTASGLAYGVTIVLALIGAFGVLLTVDDPLRTRLAAIFSGPLNAPKVPPDPGTPAVSSKPSASLQSRAALDQRPHLCLAFSGELGCSYRFTVKGVDFVRSMGADPVQARVALVGPGYANDTSGRRYILVKVRVTALTSSVNINPDEFAISAPNQLPDFTVTASIGGLVDQVRKPVQVARKKDFIGTLVFADLPTPGRQVQWLLSNGGAAASWRVPG